MKHFKNLLEIIIIISIGLFIFSASNAQQSTIHYQGSSAEIANPERGWYDQFSSHGGGSTLSTYYKTLRTSTLKKNREEDNITLILRLFYLHEFLELDDVNAVYLAKMQADFDTIRAAGIKCIVRFAYSASQSAAVWDATPEKVFSHIASVKNVLAQNSDVIAGVQAGFIGAWGEWYYTKNFASNGYSPNATDQANRKLLVEKLLDVFPPNIVVEARTPAIMKNILQSTDPITELEAFDGTYKSRVGHHNDCFMANSSDYGTYTNLATDIAYLHETTKYTITGGETCDGTNSSSNCVSSVPRMAELHWTYLNRGYNQSVFDKWEEQGCYAEVNLALGYRIRLISATIDDAVNAGSALALSLNFTNEGYAAPTQYKAIQIVLTNTSTNEKTYLNYSGTNSDIRFWLPGEVVSAGDVIIPADLEDGNYTLGIRFPDKDESLAVNPAYSIQLANAGIWEYETGINSLNHTISVGAGGIGSLPVAPSELDGTTASDTQIDLVWVDNSDNESGFEIMRADGTGMTWESIITLDANTEVYNDNTLERGKFYSYIVRAINEYGASAWSDSTTAATLGVYVPENISVDLKLYPNPLKEGTLKIGFSTMAKRTIHIYDIFGRNIYKENTNRNEIQISRDIFQTGTYLVKVLEQNGSSNAVLVVTK